MPSDADVNAPSYYGLVSNVAGRTPDLVIVPLPGVVFASPGKKLSEHGGLMQADVNVALLVYAPNLATAGSTYNATVSTRLLIYLCVLSFMCSLAHSLTHSLLQAGISEAARTTLSMLHLSCSKLITEP